MPEPSPSQIGPTSEERMPAAASFLSYSSFFSISFYFFVVEGVDFSSVV